MKIKGLLSVLVLAALLTLVTCKNDVNVFSKYKEIPVVYGLLSVTDNVHYIRIQKGYQGNGNAYLAAGVTDSIYYPDVLKVTLSGVPNGPSYLMQRVVINYNPANPLSKDSGSFAYGVNILYMDSHVLNPALTYQLQIIDTTSHDTIIAQTTLVQPFAVNSPAFTLGQPPVGSPLALSNTNPSIIDWVPAVNGAIYDVTVQFNYTETNTTNPLLSKDTFVTFTLLSSYPGNPPTTPFTANILYNTLANQLTSQENVYRNFDKHKGMVFTFSSGGNALYNYLSAATAQSGLTSDEVLPPYTNIPGGLGIFSSRIVEVVDSVQLSLDGIDSLACNSITQPLNFKDHNGNLCN